MFGLSDRPGRLPRQRQPHRGPGGIDLRGASRAASGLACRRLPFL